MPEFRSQLKSGFVEGVKKGWASFLWICKFVIPLSLAASLVQWTGWLRYLDFLFDPLARLINLPAEAALPLITGMLVNLYSAIAVMTVMPFSLDQMTLIAIFTLIAHNLILEGIVQHKSGINWAKITAVRIGAAVVTVLIVSQFLGDTSRSVAPPVTGFQTPLLDVLKGWATGLVETLTKIFTIIMGIMIALNCLRSLGWIDHILRVFRPVGRIFGLGERTATMFMAAVIFGLLYGGAIIVEESKKERFSREELEYLHISIGINHAMLEDPALFTIIGLPAFWMWVPKLLMAIALVHAWRGVRWLRSRFA